ncbi:MAG: hypothetical protein Q8P15_02290 [Nanoarchaeota archaeon]|nr:hypothetical protein [Nanoarchaeota archaeon]
MENEKKYLSLPREKRGKYYGGICIFHGIEILFAVFLIGIFLSKYFLFLFVGMSFHLLLDILDGTTFSDRIDKVSLTHDFFKFKKLRYVEEL